MGPSVEDLTVLGMVTCVSGTAWDGGPEWVRAPYAKAHCDCLFGVPE
ncbi:hypothetical protein GCM10017567_88120 [Amycolatopsis bullii]|uniref:Uncharacterized protein n=1 Tax=Amycolatopsis bullii TaxID=941987 RepID=A0ABQ3KT84_9PSEU|nr:hypothetical protein GCM10017567_88120 [Amycolatopsis bullii]